MRKSVGSVPLTKMKVAREAKRPLSIFNELAIEPPPMVAKVHERYFDRYAFQRRCVVLKVQAKADSDKEKSKDTSSKNSNDHKNDEKDKDEFFLVSGFKTYSLSLMLGADKIQSIFITGEISAREIAELAWYDLFVELQHLENARIHRALELLKKHCPDDIAHEFMRGKVTQQRFCEQLGFSRSTLNANKPANGEAVDMSNVKKPSLADILKGAGEASA